MVIQILKFNGYRTYFYLLSNDTVSNRSRTPIKKIFNKSFNKTTIQTPFLECFAILKIVFLTLSFIHYVDLKDG